MSVSDGGPAFPRPASKGNNYLTGEEDVVVDPQRGMALRDWFAGMAMQGELASQSEQEGAWPNDVIDHLAKRCYGIADAMLAERAKP